MSIDPQENIYYAQELAQERKDALACPWPWRIWAYGFWVARVLPDPQGAVLFFGLILGTIVLACLAVVAVALLVALHVTWPLWLLAGCCLRSGGRALARGVRSLARTIRAAEDVYRRWET